MAATPWYRYPYVNDYGGTEPFGNFPKPDINLQCPDGTAITTLASGTITSINSMDGHVPAWGAAMTLRLDKPVNAVATHMAYIHLMPIESHFKVGQHIAKGETIGYSGGQTAEGVEKVSVGLALYHGDSYGEGPSWSIYVGSAWLDPTPVLKAAGNSGTGSNTPQNLKDVAQAVSAVVNPNENVAQALAGMDVALQITNPFTAPSSSIQSEVSLFGIPLPVQLPTTVTDPFQYLGDIAEGLIQNFAAVFIRSLFILFGIIVLYAVVQATFVSQIGKILEPVGGLSGAIEKGAAFL